MAVTNGYVALADVLSDINIGDSADDAKVEQAIESASRLIDDWCGQRFWDDGADTTRYFTPRHVSNLRLWRASQGVESATVTSVTSVAVDWDGDGTFEETWTEGTHFFLSPRDTSSGPYDTMVALPSGGRCWPVDRPESVQVVGRFGWASVPTKVEDACAIQAAVLFKRRTEGASPIVTMDGTTLPGGSRYLDREVQLLLHPFRQAVV